MIDPIERGHVSLPAQNLAGPKELQTESHTRESEQVIAEEWVHNRTRIEEGQVVIEQYDESGKLLKITPPGYLPYGKVT